MIHLPGGFYSEIPTDLGNVTVTPNSVEMGITHAGNDFAAGSLEVTAHVLNSAGNTSTAARLLVAPYAPLVGAALYTVGNGLSVGKYNCFMGSAGARRYFN